MIISVLISLLLSLAASFLICFFIYGRRSVRENRPSARSFSALIFPLLIAFLTSAMISIDFYKAFSFLEQFGNERTVHLIIIPLSALTMLFVIIPASVHNAKKDTVICENASLTAVFLFMLTINCLCLTVIHQSAYIFSALAYLFTGALCCLTVICTPLISQDRYNRGLQKINQELSDSRNSHYEAMKQSNFEIRRTRHDIKNHLLVIRDLAQSGKKDELISYIDAITDKIESAAPPYRSGNDIADMIIADKYAKAAKRGLKLEISGDLTGISIEPSDLVTILSNMLDNAIEALSRLYGRELSEKDKIICLEFRRNSNFLFIVEQNISNGKINTRALKTSKNSPDHGFGVYNIRKAVKKYGGEFNIDSIEYGMLYKVQVEIILPIN